jgi:hypothetical protein
MLCHPAGSTSLCVCLRLASFYGSHAASHHLALAQLSPPLLCSKFVVVIGLDNPKNLTYW